MTIQELQAMIDDLRRAIASGALEIETRTNGTYKRVRYQSIADLRKALADSLVQLDMMLVGRKPPRVGLSSTGRGYR